MLISNDISPAVISQANSPTNWRYPKLTKRSRHIQPKRFENWASSPISPLCNGIHDLKIKLNDLSKGQKKILELFIYMRSRGLPNWMSRKTIANHVGISEVHVSRCLRNLKDWGFIDIYYRGKRGSNMSNVYKVADIFMKSHIWFELMGILPIFRSFFLFFCLVQPVLNPYPHAFFWASKSWKPKNVTLLINKDINKDIKEVVKEENIEQTKQWLSGLLTKIDHQDDFRRQRIEKIDKRADRIESRSIEKSRSSMNNSMNNLKAPHFLKDFKNTKNGYEKNSSPKASEYLRQQSELAHQEYLARLALIESEKGTEKEIKNNEIAAANLKKLFGI